MPDLGKMKDKLQNQGKTLGFAIPSEDGFGEFCINYKRHADPTVSYNRLREEYYTTLFPDFQNFYAEWKKNAAEELKLCDGSTDTRLLGGNGTVISKAYSVFIHEKIYEEEDDLSPSKISKAEKSVVSEITKSLDPSAVVTDKNRKSREELTKKAQQAIIEASFGLHGIYSDEKDYSPLNKAFNTGDKFTPRQFDALYNYFSADGTFGNKNLRTLADDIGSDDREKSENAKKEFFEGFKKALKRSTSDDVLRKYSDDISDEDIVKNWSEFSKGAALREEHKKILDGFRDQFIEFDLKNKIRETYKDDLDTVLRDRLGRKEQNVDLESLTTNDLKDAFEDEFDSVNAEYDNYYVRYQEINAKIGQLAYRMDFISSPYYSLVNPELIDNVSRTDLSRGSEIALDNGYTEFGLYLNRMNVATHSKLNRLQFDAATALGMTPNYGEGLRFTDNNGNELTDIDLLDVPSKPGTTFSVTKTNDPYSEKKICVVDPNGRMLVDPSEAVLDSYPKPKRPGLWTRIMNVFKTQEECVRYDSAIEKYNSFRSSCEDAKKAITDAAAYSRRKIEDAHNDHVKQYSEELKKVCGRVPISAEKKNLAFAKLLISSENRPALNADPPSVKTSEEIEAQALKRVKDPKFVYAVEKMTSSEDGETLMSGDPEKINGLLAGKDSVYQSCVKEYRVQNAQPAANVNAPGQEGLVKGEARNDLQKNESEASFGRNGF